MKSREQYSSPGISRRDFLNGVAIGIGGSLLPSAELLAQAGDAPYPPALTGLRGAHPGSFEVAHALALEGRQWPSPAAATDDLYDLIVVGGGISGLAAAWFYRQQAGPGARILVLDNHDDFGGHAKRNEFQVDGQTLIGYGGSQSIDTPSRYSAAAKGLLAALGIEVERFYRYYDRDYFQKLGLGAGIHFDRAHYGMDQVLPNPFVIWGDDRNPEAAPIDRFPLSEPARMALRRLVMESGDPLARFEDAAKLRYLKHTSYEDVLIRDFGLPAEAAAVLRNTIVAFWGVGWDAISANQARQFGMAGMSRVRFRDPPPADDRDEPYIFHFPDGNAGIARLLVRSLIPGCASGSTMEDVVNAAFDYRRLDDSASPVRVRLSSTAIEVRHAADKRSVDVTYVRQEAAHRIRARHVVLACYNRIIPYLCPELSESQREALTYAEKIPLVYVNVALRNWRAVAESGFYRFYSPQDFFSGTTVDFPVSMGDYRFSADPSRPVLVHMVHVPTEPGRGLTEREQHRLGRQRLYTTSFAEFETAIRRQLDGILGRHGFDHQRDIAAITVNRWPHGYAYEYNELWDPAGWSPENGPHVAGRAQIGRISIANSDSQAYAYVNSAIDAAHRAVREQSAVGD
jgi:spermidine dehydrogenase